MAAGFRVGQKPGSFGNKMWLPTCYYALTRAVASIMHSHLDRRHDSAPAYRFSITRMCACLVKSSIPSLLAEDYDQLPMSTSLHFASQKLLILALQA